MQKDFDLFDSPNSIRTATKQQRTDRKMQWDRMHIAQVYETNSSEYPRQPALTKCKHIKILMLADSSMATDGKSICLHNIFQLLKFIVSSSNVSLMPLIMLTIYRAIKCGVNIVRCDLHTQTQLYCWNVNSKLWIDEKTIYWPKANRNEPFIALNRYLFNYLTILHPIFNGIVIIFCDFFQMRWFHRKQKSISVWFYFLDWA